ncbi:MAG: hypothetical protein GY851_26270 [bacterium]|nr:hypothetical protein [bacterium]
MKTGDDIQLRDEVLAALQKEGCAPLVLRAVTRGISPDSFDYFASEATQEGVSQCIERLKHERKGVLVVWLEQATRGLGITGKRRIYEELVAHYDDAFGHAIESGLTEADAQVAVVRELGSAREANKAFRRACLTQSQEYSLRMTPAPLGIKVVLKSVALPALFAFSQVMPFLLEPQTRIAAPMVVLPALAFLFLYAYIKRVHVPALLRENLLRKAVVWRAAADNAGVLVFWLVMYSWLVLIERVWGSFPITLATVTSIGCLVPVAITTVWSASILRKLGKAR